jgi:hypothetical protein
MVSIHAQLRMGGPCEHTPQRDARNPPWLIPRVGVGLEVEFDV